MNSKNFALAMGFLLGGRRKSDLGIVSSPDVRPLSNLEKGLGASSEDSGTLGSPGLSRRPSADPRSRSLGKRDYKDDADEGEPIPRALGANSRHNTHNEWSDRKGVKRESTTGATTRHGTISHQPQQRRRYAQTVPLSIFKRIKRFIFPPHRPSLTSTEEHTYRLLPILSGIAIPFSILLSIPGLTEHWYIITENDKTVLTRPNGKLLDAGMGISLTCALIANIAIIIRFMEKQVLRMTLLAIAGLTIHDVISIIAVTTFGVQHRFSDGFTYGQSFWFTVCATIVSTFTNVTLIIDYVVTRNFATSGSGLTHAQRSLITILIVLFLWVALGALVNSITMDLTFINGLYFTIVTINTIGFGDFVPQDTGSRVFVAFHSTFGIINLALAVTLCRETVVEAFEHAYRERFIGMLERRKERREMKARAMEMFQALRGRQVVDGEGEGGGEDGKEEQATTEQHGRFRRKVKIMHTPKKDEDNEKAGQRVQLRRTLSDASVVSVDSTFVKELQKDFWVKLIVAWSLFVTFWIIGAVIFMKTEKWTFGLALWFCFESFSTIGYGERTPTSPAGRSVFIVWAMLGVGTMTILISVLSEAYSSRYESIFADPETSSLGPTSPSNETIHVQDGSFVGSEETPGEETLIGQSSSRGELGSRLRRTSSCPTL